MRREVVIEQLAALPGHAERAAEQRLGRRRAEQHDRLGLDDAPAPATSQGRQASTSKRFGVWWMRRRPRSSNLKCLTTLVT